MNVLVVDDEKEIADLIEVILTDEGYTVNKFYDPQKALESISVGNIPDLAVIDIMMPVTDGFTICAKIRTKYNFPIIMLTAKTEDADKIAGLTVGADDYITKPFNPLEFVARVRAQLRRYKNYNPAYENPDVHECSGLIIDRKRHTVTLYDEDIFLTPTEFNILWLLCENAGNVVSAETIFESVWQEKYLDSNNTVMVHIRRIREKLHEPSKNPRYIKTVWGVGYKFEKSFS